MTYQLYRLPASVLFASGLLKPSWKVAFFLTGTSTPAPVYTTSALTTTHTQPVQADAAGVMDLIYLDPSITYKSVVYDQFGAEQPSFGADPVNDNLLSQTAIGEVLYPTTTAEDTAGVTPSNKSYAPYVRGRYSNFEDWRAACDEAGAEGSLEADYAITANTELPKKCDFKGFKITGAFRTRHTSYLGGYVYNWVARQPHVRGCFFCQYTGVNTEWDLSESGEILVDGNGDGTAWCDMQITFTRRLSINNDSGYVNFNRFHDGISRFVHLYGSSPTSDLHANKFVHLDATTNGAGVEWGYLNECAKNQVNFIDQPYYEGGADVVGNFDIHDFQGDHDSPPRVDRYNYVQGAVGVNEKNSVDFFPLSVRNLARGGCWDWLDSAGKPPNFFVASGASVAVVADTTEPCGAGLRYKADFTAAASGFQIILQPAGQIRASVWIYYKSTDNFAVIETTGPIFHNADPVIVDSVNNWKLLRLAVSTSKTATTAINLYAYPGGGGGATKTMSLGSVFAGAGKASIAPVKNEEYQTGIYTPTLTGVANVDATTASEAQWTKVNGNVIVSGQLSVDPTAAATLTQVGLSLPLTPATFTAGGQCAGVCAATSFVEAGRISADTANGRAELGFISGTNTNHAMGFWFMYRL